MSPKHNNEHPIWLECPHCGAERPLKALVWEDLQDAGIIGVADRPSVMKACPRCSYKERSKGQPMSEAQKEKRRAYQKSRRERVSEELALARELKEAQGKDANDDNEGPEGLKELLQF